MVEKRKHPRYPCTLKAQFEYYEGNPEELDTQSMRAIKGKGYILDISKGGLFLVSTTRVGINAPLTVTFATKRKKYAKDGTTVRTGLLMNNPSEVAKRFAHRKVGGDTYIAIQFKDIIEDLTAEELE